MIANSDKVRLEMQSEATVEAAGDNPIDAPLSECALAQAIAAIGDAWTLLILREILCGATRFEQMQKDLGISRAILADRLKRGVKAGILEKVSYKVPGRRQHYSYDFTARGRALLPALLALRQWADEFLRVPRSSVSFTDSLGSAVHVSILNEHGQEVASADVHAVSKRSDRMELR